MTASRPVSLKGDSGFTMTELVVAITGGIGSALAGVTDISFVPAATSLGSATFMPSGGNTTSCYVSYSGTTGVASATTTGC